MGSALISAADKVRPPRVVLLTGGMGCGKSSAAAAFLKLGVPVIDADLVARAIHQDSQHPVMAHIAQALPQLLTEDGCLRRGILRTVLATDSHVNRCLRNLLQPYVMQAMRQWTLQQTAAYVIWESALLPDEVDGLLYDSVLLLQADEETRMQRIRLRNPDWTEIEIRQVFNMQADEYAFREQAHTLMVNQGSSEELSRLVLQQHLIYKSHWDNK
ncbi:dephospho-CoA kinase [Undibacterium pigrum]|uniref:Dephospho-CoA kinase n=1 Tax=Undibacterium pigrum TaxID=401470 RepID=A0A318J8S5_9BURK|nr:dephospho-CoA kinase [Undibacterium pigrum]PXX40298.1 dephospho-CoA kinase [Undibacterium pigrum]